MFVFTVSSVVSSSFAAASIQACACAGAYFCRKAFQLLQYFCGAFPQDKPAVLQQGKAAITRCLSDEKDSDLLRAALSLACLLLSDLQSEKVPPIPTVPPPDRFWARKVCNTLVPPICL